MIAFLALLLASSLPGPVTGDFDHDGKPDTAEIVREGRDVYLLQITRGAAFGAPERVRLGLSAPDYMQAATRGGPTPTACGKGAGPADTPCPRTSVTVRPGDLTLGHAEASQAVLAWDGQSFSLEWVAD
jgi:hypothetical protein